MKKMIVLSASLVVLGAYSATISVVVPQEGAAKTVTVSGKASVTVDAGKSVALKATADSGWAFAGWYESYDAETDNFSNEAALANSVDWRSPSANYVAGESDVTLYARFVKPGDDILSFDLESVFSGLAVDVDDFNRPILSLTNAVDETLVFDSSSLPTVTMTGLPTGLKFDKASLRLTGTPAASGVFKVAASAKNASGYSFSQVFYVRVENTMAARVQGNDAVVALGEEVDDYLDNFFDIDTPTNKVVSLSGLPTGLALVAEDDDYFIRGTPSKVGEYLVSCKVAFSDGVTETASMLYRVEGPDPFDYDGNVDFSILEGYSVGDSILAEDEMVIGEYDSEYKVGVTAVSGLPSGVTAVKTPKDDGDGYVYVLAGMFKKAGTFTVTVKVAYEDIVSEAIVNETLTKEVIVTDSPGVYLNVAVLDESLSKTCKVSGAGVYSAGATAKLKATPGNGYVFTGWCDYAGVPIMAGPVDYRNPAASVDIVADAELEWFAAFAPKGEDYVDIGDLDGMEMEIDTMSGDVFSESFVVDSGSLPTLKFTNLPAGISCVPSAEIAGEYILSYNPATARQAPSPGRYKVTATATNASRMSDSATFLITVKNIVDSDIHVEDDYGVLTPNVAMDPISFSSVVDFARGDTLAVSGLPQGLKYNDKSAPLCLSGTPTKPGEYTLVFAAKIVESAVTNEATKRVTYTYRNAKATAFIKVKDFPTIAAVLSDEASAAGCKVTGVGSFKAGTKVTLKAAAAADWTFAGWSGIVGVDGLAALNPSLAYVMGAEDLTEVETTFIHKRDDVLFVGDPGVVAVVKGEEVSTNLVETLVETRSLPTVVVSGLPAGLKFDAKTFLISGTVGNTAKTGYVYVTVAAKNASGYTFTRILKFAVLDAVGDDIPEEPVLPNDANIDFSELDGLATGDYCPQGAVDSIGFAVYPSYEGAAVTAVSVSGLPAGLKSAVLIVDDTAWVEIFGTPSKPARCEIKVQVTYSDRTKATSQYALIVEDGGSGWLDVDSFDEALGTVAGAGVYASGATVKLSAKPASGNVFAGWYEDEYMPFDILAETDGVDYRTAAASFVFRKSMLGQVPFALYGDFIAKGDDEVSIEGLGEVWEIDPAVDDELQFTVNSASLPKLTVTGLPKGVSLDAVAGKLVYSSLASEQVVSGFYTATLKVSNQSGASATAALSIFVANKTTDAIGGLDPAADAYAIHAGVSLEPELIMPEIDVADGWKLSVAGLPAGLKLVQDSESGAYSVSGVPTKAGTNTVTFTATRGREKEIATITLSVAALPMWASGTYDGGYFEFGDGETNVVGQVTATVSESGKISGKILKGGKTYSFSAASYEKYDSAEGKFVATVIVPWSTVDKESFGLSVGANDSGLGIAMLEPVGDGAYSAEVVQNVWLRKDIEVPAFATGVSQPVLPLLKNACCGMESYDLRCKFGAKGVVTVTGKVNGINVTSKSQLLATAWDGAELDGSFVIYVANSQLDGGAYCKIVDVVLSDTDGDGKLDSADFPE